MYKDDPKTSPIKEAYKYYNNIDEKYYHMFINEEVMEELAAIDSVEEISDAINTTVKDVANVNYSNDIDILNAWKNLMKQTIIAEYEDDFGTEIYFLGFKIEMASDRKFKHIIYEDNIRINFEDLDDFAFKLNGIFKKWENKPEELLIRCTFIDHVLGIEIQGNTVIITKEWYKYLINNSPVSRLTDISTINKNIINDPMKVIELNNESTINFINTIKCIVRKESDQQVSLGSRSIDQKVIFKPIFYKVKDLQNITLRTGVVQNIGLNLAEYMTKVDTFKIVIGTNEYIETGRNDIFVIFKVNANDITTSSGMYNVIDGEGEYISSGNWNLV